MFIVSPGSKWDEPKLIEENKLLRTTKRKNMEERERRERSAWKLWRRGVWKGSRSTDQKYAGDNRVMTPKCVDKVHKCRERNIPI